MKTETTVQFKLSWTPNPFGKGAASLEYDTKREAIKQARHMLRHGEAKACTIEEVHYTRTFGEPQPVTLRRGA